MRRATGPRPIGEILPGDQVWAYRFEAGSWELCEVKERLDNTYSGPVISITVDSTTIEATAYHPFWVIEGRDLQERSKPRELQEHEDEGHSLPGRWINSHELRAGDCIITRSGTRALITEIRQHFAPAFPVSNLTIFGHHNYSVGDVGVLVHNVSVCDGTIADLRKLRADGMSEDKINDWLRSKTDDNGNRLYNDDEIEKALGRILAPKEAAGGTYKLIDPDTNGVVRTGRTKNLDARRKQHAKADETKDLDFEIDRRTDVYAEQRGREEIIYDLHPEARIENGGLNKIRAIRPDNPRIEEYRAAGRQL